MRCVCWLTARPSCAGSEGFAGNYTPMYLYANPGAWGSLLGVDFVRNHAISNLDYATMHVYVDQWLCTADGATEDGQLAFMKCACAPLHSAAAWCTT